ncbi:DUF5017 domain-containing protein [Proteiniphilum sp. UBA5384]|uniref:DUF5017 domain-containing protein n=1 Tax=Proteiniphilum sp. UBA5384 TaxID=1947279 RepID=UPI0025DAF1AB|nr:DUF5017 domain-containing protein [Proteiniphilum sp. UBA5384]
MKAFKILQTVLISFVVLLIGCNTEDLKPGDDSTVPGNSFSLTVEMQNSPASRIALGQNDLTITLKWEMNDEIQLLFVQNDNKYKETATVNEIMEEGKKARFVFDIPAGIVGGQFDLYGVYGGEGLDEENLELVKLPANPGSASSLYLLQESEDVVLIFTKEGINLEEKSANVVFNHLGSIFSIRVNNTGATPLSGISEARLVTETGGWAYNNTGEGKYNLVTGEFQSPGSAGAYLSFTPPTTSIPAGESITLWGWYPSLPDVIWPEIRLQLLGNWGAPIVSTDSKDARTSPTETGKAFYFEAYWNGTDFAFEEPLSVTTSGDPINAGEEQLFAFAGDISRVEFYSGEPGHVYEYKDRTERELEGDVTMSFMARVMNGYEFPMELDAFVSNNFSGEYTYAAVSAADWTSFSDKITFPLTNADGPAGDGKINNSIKITDLMEQGKTFWVGFRYICPDRPPAPRNSRQWRIGFYTLNHELSGETISLSNYNDADWNSQWTFITEGNVESGRAPSIVTADGKALNFLGNQTSSYEGFEAWGISNAHDIFTVDPDEGVTIESPSEKYSHLYAAVGTYEATFVLHGPLGTEPIVKKVNVTVLP